MRASPDDSDIVADFVEAARELLETRIEGETDRLVAARALEDISRSAKFLLLGQVEALSATMAAALGSDRDLRDTDVERAVVVLRTLIDGVGEDNTDTGHEDDVRRICVELGAMIDDEPAPPFRRRILRASQLTLAPRGEPRSAQPDDPTERGAAADRMPISEAFKDDAMVQLDQAEHALLRLEAGDTDPELIHSAFRAFHSFKGNAGCVALDDFEEVSHSVEEILDRVRRDRLALDPDLSNAILLVIDHLRDAVARLGTPGSSSIASKAQLLSSLVVESRSDGDSRPAVAELESPRTERGEVAAPSRFVRVEVEKLDTLLNQVGELISASASVAQSPDLDGLSLDRFHVAVGRLDRVTAAIHDTAMAMRMVPLERLFTKLARTVRDVKSRLHKAVELEVAGETTEVDKSILETLADPLLHLVRNAVDHGIESEDARIQAGKPAQGRVRLAAKHHGNEVWLTVEDDGRGIDPARLRAVALERGLVDEGQLGSSDQEAFQLMFLPGFSTASEVTNVSGRGVGMDVVRSQVEAIRGRVEVDSTVGQGASFTIRVPLTLAIIEAMIVEIGESLYAVPLLSVRESVCVENDAFHTLPGGVTVVRIRHEMCPVVALGDVDHSCREVEAGSSGILVLLEETHRVFGLRVDGILGQRQIVIKPLDGYLGALEGISGCSIMGTGQICLVLDVSRLASRWGAPLDRRGDA